MPVLVNEERIEDAEIREEARKIRPRMLEAMADEDPLALEAKVKEWARENVIERVLVRQAAVSDPGGLERATAHLSPPRNKDITEHYRKTREQFAVPERVKAGHIVKNVDEDTDEAAALAAIQLAERKLSEGAVFEEVADELSDCAGNGGQLGVFPRGEMVAEFESVVFAMAPGEVSSIFRSPFGFHIAKVYERRPEGVAPLEEVREHLATELFEEKKRKAVEQYLDRLWAKASIQDL